MRNVHFVHHAVKVVFLVFETKISQSTVHGFTINERVKSKSDNFTSIRHDNSETVRHMISVSY